MSHTPSLRERETLESRETLKTKERIPGTMINDQHALEERARCQRSQFSALKVKRFFKGDLRYALFFF